VDSKFLRDDTGMQQRTFLGPANPFSFVRRILDEVIRSFLVLRMDFLMKYEKFPLLQYILNRCRIVLT